MSDESSDSFTVVVNHEEQYSIWSSSRDMPLGWSSVGVSGAREDCLTWIEANWTDMRPLSLRKFEEQRHTERVDR